MMGEQQAIEAVDEALGAGEVAAWLALVAAVAALVAWGLTELVNRKWLSPWKASLRSKAKARALAAGEPEPEPEELLGWWWVGMVATIAALIGCAAGAVVCELTPIGSAPLGALVGLGAGASPAWIVRRVKSKAKSATGGDD